RVQPLEALRTDPKVTPLKFPLVIGRRTTHYHLVERGARPLHPNHTEVLLPGQPIHRQRIIAEVFELKRPLPLFLFDREKSTLVRRGAIHAGRPLHYSTNQRLPTLGIHHLTSDHSLRMHIYY